MRTVTDDRVPLFVGERVERIIVPPFTAMGLENTSGEVVAGVVFNGFTQFDIDVTIAGHGWTKGFIADVGDYLFRQLGVLRLTVVTEQPSVERIARRLGGTVEGVMTNHFGVGRHGTLIGILKENWQF